MWIEDLTKALWILNGDSNIVWKKLIQRIEDNLIYFTDGTKEPIQKYVDLYNKSYGVSNN